MRLMFHCRIFLFLPATLAIASCDSDSISGPSNDVAAVSVSAPRSDIRVGQAVQLAATPVNSSGSLVSGQTITWSSSNEAVATVSSSGQLVGVSPGAAKITATASGKAGTLDVSVSLVPVSTIEVTSPTNPLPAGVPVQLSVVAKDSANRVLSGRQFTFTSSNNDVATVSATGVVTGKIPGGTLITVGSEGKLGSATFNVVPGPASSIAITGGDVYAGTSTQLTATLRDPAGNTLPTGSFTWSTSDATKVNVSQSGVITGVSGGSSTITASASGVNGTFTARTIVVRAIESGTFTTCFLDDNGVAYCVGRNSHAESGTGFTSTQPLANPTRVAGNLRFTTISVGASHACALTADGTAWCWGANTRGALGDATFVDRPTPVQVGGGLRFAAIAAGHDHSCGLVSDGTAYCWGGVNYPPMPTKISSAVAFKSITAGLNAACALDTTGQAWCWGNNEFYQFGTGDRIGSLTPRQAATTTRFIEIDQEYANICARTESGDVWCWGSQGPFGLPSTPSVPQKQAVSSPMFLIGTGFGHVCGIDEAGAAYCWGVNNAEGQQGNGTQTSRSTPTPVNTSLVGSASFVAIRAGFATTCAITRQGVPYCWGRAEPLGNTGTDLRTVPVLLRNP